VGVIIVQAHEIDIEQDDLWPADLEPPHKEFEQDPAATRRPDKIA
jgi:hypothetical protein